MKNALLFLLFFAAVYLIPLGSRPLVAPDEFRYAEIPREMLVSRDFVVPRLFGEPYFEKPVLGYWMTAASFSTFGISRFSVRLPAALATGITALFVMLWVFSALHDRRQALLAGVMYLGCGMVYVLGVCAVLDSPMTMYGTAAAVCAFGYLQPERARTVRAILLALCGVFCGLGFLTKGVPALVGPVLGSLGFVLVEKRWKELVLMPWLPALFAAVVVLPWALAVHRADGDFWRYFIEVEHLQRFSSGGGSQHPQPWWFLLPFFFGGLFPSALLLCAGAGSFRATVRRMASVPLYRFCLCAAVLPLILFSCSKGKLPTYILPCFPPAAVLMAGFVSCALREHQKSEKIMRLLFDFFGCLAAGGGILAVFFCIAVQTGLIPEPAGFSPVCGLTAAAAASAAAGGALLLLSRKTAVRARLWFFAVFIMIPCAVIPFFITGELNESKMPSAVFERVRRAFDVVPERVEVVTTPALMHAAAWKFSTCDVRLLDAVGEMEYAHLRAKKEGRVSPLMTRAEFARLLRRKDRKDVLYIHWSDRPCADVPDVRPASVFPTREITAKYYPAEKKRGGEENK